MDTNCPVCADLGFCNDHPARASEIAAGLREMGEHPCRADLPMGAELREAASRLTTLEAENADLQAKLERAIGHIAEHNDFARTRIQDGKELGAAVWRIALEDIAREGIATLFDLTQSKEEGDA